MKNKYVNGRVKYKDICNLYSSGKTSTEISQTLNIGKSSIFRVLKSCNVKVRSSSEVKRKYKLDEDFFSVIDTEAKAYWFGFILADGWIMTTKCNTHCLGITLAAKDMNHLAKFRDLIQPSRPLYKKIMGSKWFGAGNTYYKFEVSSDKIYNDLIKLGCTERKSLTLKFPTIPKDFVHHFIRGYFDGDGSVYITQDIPCISIMSTKEFLEVLLTKTNISKTGKGIYSKRNDGNNSYYLQLKRSKRFKLFYDYIYNNATIYLERKKQVFESYFKKTKMFRDYNHPAYLIG